MEGINNIQQLAAKLNEKKEGKKSDDAQDAFLTLLTTQMRHQDPFQPMQSGEFLTQIAQFTTATGIGDLKQSFADLSVALTSNQALQASSLVGREILVQSDKAVLGTQQPLAGKIDLPQASNAVTLLIHDAAGQPVRSLNLGPRDGGQVDFTWDGLNDQGARMAPGVYGLQATALVDGNQVAMETSVYSRVDSVTLGAAAGGVQVNVDGVGSRRLSQVLEIK